MPERLADVIELEGWYFLKGWWHGRGHVYVDRSAWVRLGVTLEDVALALWRMGLVWAEPILA
jgi:hypothetical protein